MSTQKITKTPGVSESLVVLDQARRCDECGGAIPAGEGHQLTTLYQPARTTCYRACARCMGLAEWASAALPGFGWEHGSLIAEVREEVYARAGGLLDGLGRHLPPGFMGRPKLAGGAR